MEAHYVLLEGACDMTLVVFSLIGGWMRLQGTWKYWIDKELERIGKELNNWLGQSSHP